MLSAECGISRQSSLTQRRKGAKRADVRTRILHSFLLCASAPLRENSPSLSAAACLLIVFFSSGCTSLFHRGGGLLGPGPIENPLFIPPVDRELLWNQTVDAVDDYFRIEREDRVRLIGGVLTEGRIDTFPTVGSTLFEPWRRDSTMGYEKLHATLQSIRRRATVRVIPVEGGTLLDVIVQKELEDLDKPEHATAGGATLRHDGTIVRQELPPGRFSITLGWIPIGRDMTLEQRILADIAARLDVHPSAAHPAVVTEEALSPLLVPAGPELRPPQSGVEVLPPPLLQNPR
jgi:hypothetical protein